jgi:hypothetical protein
MPRTRPCETDRGYGVKAVFTGWLAVIGAGLIYMFAIVALGR